jgi:hypothetical protein
MAVKLVCEEACLRLEVLQWSVWQLPAAVPGKAFAFPYDRGAAALDRLRNMAPAVGGGARPCEEGRAGRGAPAVGGQAFDCGPLEQRENVVNQVFSFTSSSPPGSSTGASGAS